MFCAIASYSCLFSVLDLKNARDRLKKYRKKMETDATKLQNKAKDFIRNKDKSRALMALKVKMSREKQLQSIDGQLMSVLDMIDRVEWAAENVQIMNALKTGTAALNKLHQEMSIDDVCDILDEANEAVEMENSINAVIAGQFNPADELELERELAELVGDSIDSSAASAEKAAPGAVVQLPDVPSAPILPRAPDTVIQPVEAAVDVNTSRSKEEKRTAALA